MRKKGNNTSVKLTDISSQNVSLWDRYARVIVFLFPVLLYLNTLSNGFNMDDELVTNNHRLTSKGISAIPEIFRSPYYQDAQGYQYEYRPVSQAIFALQHSILGEKASVSHAINALLYGLLCLLLFSILQQLFPGYKLFNILVVSLFAAHPAHTEVVASIKNREEILAFLFGFLAWWIAVRLVQKNLILALGSVFMLMLAAVLCKPSVAPLVGIIPFSLLVLKDISKRNVMLVYFFSALAVVPWLNIAVPGIKILLLILGALALLLLMLWYEKNLLRQWVEMLKAGKSVHDYVSGQLDRWAPLSRNTLYWSLPLVVAICLLIFLPVLQIFIIMFCWLWLAYLVYLRQHALFLFLFSALSPFLSHLLQLDHAYPCLIAFVAIPLQSRKERQAVFAFSDLYLLLLVFSHLVLGYTDSVMLIFILTIIRILDFRIIWQLLLLFDVLSSIIEASYSELYQFNMNWIRISGFIMLFYFLLYFFFMKKWVTYLRSALLLVCCFIWISVLPPSPDSLSFLTPLTSPSPSTDVRPLQFAEYPFTYLYQDMTKLATSLDVSLRYLRLLIVPYPLSFYYGYSVIKSVTFAGLTPWIAVLIWSFLIGMMFWFGRRNFRLFLGMAISISGVLFFSNPLGFVPGMMGDRFLFFPVLGLSLILAYLFFMSRYSRYLIWSVLIIYSGLTISRNQQWKDKITLFTADIPHLDSSAQAQNMLGLEYVALARKSSAAPDTALLRQAVFHFQQAVAIWPNFFNATYDLARLHMELKDYNQGLYWYQQAVRLDTTFSRCYTAMAFIYENRGDMDSAVWAYDRAVSTRGDDLSVFNNYSFLLFRLKRLEESVAVNRQAMQYHPQAWEPVMNIGKTFIALQRYDSAEVYFTRAHALNKELPTWEQVQAGLGNQK